MSFTVREKRRRKEIAVAQARKQHGETMQGRHYLTVVSRTCSCNDCGARLCEGGECVYRNRPREILCKRCADKRGIVPRISTRWERQRERQRKGSRRTHV